MTLRFLGPLALALAGGWWPAQADAGMAAFETGHRDEATVGEAALALAARGPALAGPGDAGGGGVAVASAAGGADLAAAAGGAAIAPIVVTGRPLARTPGQSAYATSLLDADKLAASASARLEDALRDIPGFQQFRRLDSRSANPSTQGVTLRGLGGNASARALVLLDGVPVGDPFAGWIPYSALPPERLALARVTRGGGAGPFGSGAVVGTIELESATRDERSLAQARVLGGSRNALEAALALTPTVGGGFASLDARFDRGDGYVLIPEAQRGPVDIPAAYKAWSVAGRLVAPLGQRLEAQLRIAGFRDERVRGLPGADNLAAGQDVSLRLLLRGDWQAELLAYAQGRNFATVARAADARRQTATTTLDQFRTPATGHGGKLELRPAVPQGRHLRVGLDWRFAEGATNERFSFVAGAPTRLREAGGRARTLGGFLEADAQTGPLLLTGGVRVDGWRLAEGRLSERAIATGLPTQLLAFPDRSGTEVTARGGTQLTLAPGLALRAAAYRGFRLPTLNELYRPFRVGADATAANPALSPERLRGVEAGLDWRPLPDWQLSLTGFHNRLEGAIANVTLARGPGVFPQVGFVSAAGSFRQRQNLDAVRASGLEVEAAARRGWLSARAGYALALARVEADGAAAPLDGRRPAQTPRHQLSAALTLAPPPASLTLAVRHAARQAEDDLGQRQLPAATTLDAALRVPLRAGLAITVRAENLFDEEVVAGVSATGIRDLGQPRTIWAGLAWAL